jgi:hypothetical protein
MKWSTENPYGDENYWGVQAGPGASEACASAQDRILAQMAESGDFYKLVCALAEPHGDWQEVWEDIEHAFEIDTTVGVNAEVVGGWLDEKRRAAIDSLYRTVLKIKGRTVLSSTGTGETVLQIVREYVGVGPGPIVLTRSPPYSFLLTVPAVIGVDDRAILFPLIRKALIAGELGLVIVLVTGGALWGSQSVAVTGAGVWGSQSVVVAGATNWSLMETI